MPRYGTGPLLLLLASVPVILLHAWLDLWCYSVDDCTTLYEAARISFGHELSLTGLKFYGPLKLGPLANYLAASALALTGSAKAVYLLANAGWAASMFLLYPLLRRDFGRRTAFWAALVFFLSPASVTRLPSQLNEAFLFFFVVPCYFCITRGSSGRRARFLTYVLVGCMAQLHILSLALIPLAWVVWRMNGARPDFRADLAGIGTVILLHTPVWLHGVATHGSDLREAAAPLVGSAREEGLRLILVPVRFLGRLPEALFMSATCLLILFPWTCRARRWEAGAPAKGYSVKSLLAASLVYLFVVYVGATFRNRGALHPGYFIPLLPFLACLAGISMSLACRQTSRPVYAALCVCVLLLSLGVACYGHWGHRHVPAQYAPVRSLDAQRAYLIALRDWMSRNPERFSGWSETICYRRLFERELVCTPMPRECSAALARILGLSFPLVEEGKGLSVHMYRAADEPQFQERLLGREKPVARWEREGVVFCLTAEPRAEDQGLSLPAGDR